MIVKSFKYAMFLTLITIGISCANKQESKEKFNTQNPASGLVNGKVWKFQSGVAFKSEIFGIDDFTIHLIDTVVSNICDRNYTKIVRVSISMTEISEGKFDIAELKLEDELNGLSFFDPEIHGILDTGEEGEEGFFEITLVDEKQKLIKGTIDVTLDENNVAKGDFAIEWCPDI